jgi:AraC-like DNA-binding protein
MIYKQYSPPPPLSDFVESLWHYDGYEPPHAEELVLPSGTVEVIISLRSEPLRLRSPKDPGAPRSFHGAAVSGVQSSFCVIDTAPQRDIMGIHFRPGGAAALLGVPADALKDDHAELSALWGRAATEMTERLVEAGSAEERFAILTEALLRRRPERGARHPAVRWAISALSHVPLEASIEEMADAAGLSHRRFIELFRREVGVPPKLFARIQRFQAASRLIAQEERPGWPELALACGYFDQAHFINEVRGFAGVSPTAFESLLGPQRAHVPVGERGQILPIPVTAAPAESPPRGGLDDSRDRCERDGRQ